MTQSTLSYAALAVLVACDTVPPVEETEMADPCQATQLERDFALFDEANGPSRWTDLPADAVIAATYLRLDPENLDVFEQASGPVIGDLSSGRAGLLHFATAQSIECGTARTLTVWESESAMMDFVTGDAHLAAMEVTSLVSRGGSITDVWSASELSTVDFAGVAEAFAEHDGPVY